MRVPSRWRVGGIVVLAAAALATGSSSVDASGGRKTFEDKQRGYRVTLGDRFEQVPPKLTPDTAYIVGQWYEDAAKFKGRGGPEFLVFWFATPKKATVTPTGDGKDKPKDPAATSPEDVLKKLREESIPKSMDEFIDKRMLARNPTLFGPDVHAAKDVWKNATKAHTKTQGVDALYFDVNDPDDRRTKKPEGPGRSLLSYTLVAKLEIDRPGETIEVGLLGECGLEFAKDGKTNFIEAVKSFEDLSKIATDSRNLGAQKELDPDDPEAFRKTIHQSKVIKGWACIDTPHYCVLYDTEVDPGLARKIGEQLESLRAQVYETVFPPDKPIKAISVVRCCKDHEQYAQYGGPAGSAGYWSSGAMELVFYEDRNRKDDSLRVLYHEGFHQFIHYSVGEMDPHSWFNEGDGDYFFGFNYEGGKWVRGINTWRRDLAKKAKREHKFPELWEWLHWSQGYYYGMNKSGVSIGDNYALGWDFVYFLRTTKKKEYEGILERYFVTLKGFVTRAREAREAEEKARKDAPAAPPAAPPGPPAGGDAKPPDAPPAQPPAPPGPGTDPSKPADPAKPADPPSGPAAPPPTDPAKPADPPKSPETPKPRRDPMLYDRQLWLDKALEEAFKGVDMKQLEKDWLDAP